MELQVAETKVYTGFEAIERMRTHWINSARGCWKIEGNKLFHKYYGETEVTESNMHLYFFLENEFTDYEEPLKVGDWVVHDKYIVKITEVFDATKYRCDYISSMRDQILDTKYIERKATPEEIAQEKRRRVFAKVGREVDEFKRGDVVTMSAGDLSEVIVEELTHGLIKCAQFDGYNQTFDTFNINPKRLKLVVPVEQRLDKEDE